MPAPMTRESRSPSARLRTCRIPAAPTSFDHWADQRRGLAECRRVLAPGGHLVLVDQFPLWLVPTLVFGRRVNARTKYRANTLLRDAAFRPPECDGCTRSSTRRRHRRHLEPCPVRRRELVAVRLRQGWRADGGDGLRSELGQVSTRASTRGQVQRLAPLRQLTSRRAAHWRAVRQPSGELKSRPGRRRAGRPDLIPFGCLLPFNHVLILRPIRP